MSNLTAIEFADKAADWLEQEMKRPIVRQEWNRLDSRGIAPRLWVMVIQVRQSSLEDNVRQILVHPSCGTLV